MKGKTFFNAIANRKSDVLQGKSWGYLDEDRRKSKRQKDLADIIRLLETYPELEDKVPAAIRKKIK